MTAWVMGIVGAIVMTTLIDVVMQEGETKKYVKGIASLLVLASIVAPLPGLFGSNFEIDFDSQASESTVNEEYLQRIYMERYKEFELTIQKQLKEQGIDGVTIRININYNRGMVEIINIIVDKSLMVITSSDANIDINKIIVTTIKKSVSVDESKIFMTE